MVIENFADVLENPSIVKLSAISWHIVQNYHSKSRDKKKVWFDKILNVNNNMIISFKKTT